MDIAPETGPNTLNDDAGPPSGGLSESAPTPLPQMLDLPAAQALRELLSHAIAEGGFALDAAAVERLSTPCAQLLLSACRSANSACASFKIFNASDVFRTALADLGLQSEFSKWMI